MEKIVSAVAEFEASGGFVRHQDGRIVGERAGNRDPLLLAAGNVARELVGVFGDFHFGQQFKRAFPAAHRRVIPVEIHREHNVLNER